LIEVSSTVRGNSLTLRDYDPHGPAPMAKPNYAYARRQRDLAKKQKQEEKRRRKTGTPDAQTPDTQSPPVPPTPADDTPAGSA